MTDEDRLQAFLGSTQSEVTPRKPAPPLPINRTVTASGNGQGQEHDFRMLRDEMVKMRYILEEIRDDRVRPRTEEHHGCISEEQFEELKSIVHTRPQEDLEERMDELLATMAKIRNDILKLTLTIRRDMNNMTKANLIESIEGYAIDIANVLSDNGVTMSRMVDEEYNPTIHVISSVVETNDPSLQGKVAESTGDYYEKDGRIILRNGVKVYRYVKDDKALAKMRKQQNVSEEVQ